MIGHHNSLINPPKQYAILLICDIMDLLFLLSGFIRYTFILVLCE